MSTATPRRVAPSRVGADRDYMALVKAFPLRQISSDAEYDRAAEVLDGLVLRELTKGERDYLDALTLIVAAYDDEHHPPPGLERRTPLQRLKWLMESAGMTPSQLGDVIQSRPAASMFLNGTRKELSKPQIRRLARHFNLDPGFFF